MGSQNDGDPKDTKPPRRGRLFEVSPPPEAAASDGAPPPAPAAEQGPAEDAPEDAPAEPLTEPISPIASEDIHSIDSASVAPVEDASDASIKLARDERMKKPVPASSYLARSKGGEVLVRRSAPAVDLHPAPPRRGLGWLWLFVPAVLLVAVLGWLYAAGYTIGPQGLVPPRASTR
jgi:hypothetical protein